MKKKLILLSSLLLINSFSITSCDNSSSNNNDTKSERESISISQPEEIDEVIVVNNGDKIYKKGHDNAKQLKISFTEAGFGREWLVEIAKRYVAEHDDCQIVLDGDPALTGSLSTKLESGKNLSDIYFPLNSYWELYAYKGWLEPLDDLYEMKPDGTKTNNELVDGPYLEWATLDTVNGTHKYIMPWNDTITGICYNVNMFNDYGWEIPITTDDLENLCKQILNDTNGRVKPFAYPGKIGGYFDFIGSTWWMQASGMEGYKKFFDFESPEIYNKDTQPALGKKLALEEFLRFYNLDSGYCVVGSMSKDHILSQMDFINGKAAMIVNANWLETEMKENMDEDFVMGMMRVPYLKDAKKDEKGEYKKVNYVASPDYIVVPKDSTNKDVAKDFLNYMNKEENLRLYTYITGSPRPFDYIASDIEGLTKFNQDCLKIREESDNYFDFSRAKIYTNGYGAKYIGGQPYSGLIRGDTTIERFLNTEYFEADDNWETWLARSS